MKPIVKPSGKIEYERLGKRVELITLAANFYLLTAMRNIADTRAEKGHTFLKSKKKLFDDLTTAHDKDTENLEKLFLAYLLLAVATELQNENQITTPEKKKEKIVGTFLEELPKEGLAVDLLKYLKQTVSTCDDALSFFESAKMAFDKLKWGSGFGGKKWRDIADTVIMRLKGKIDAVVFVDTIFDIEHHNGHVFDKHDKVDCDSEKLKIVLDSKRDCALEEMCKKFIHECKYASSRIKTFYARGVAARWWKEIKNGNSKKNE